MTTTREREAPDFAELDEEREVDLRRYWNALLVRWWLPVIGVVAGVIVGYLFTLGGNQVYQATALISLGTPYVNSVQVQGLPTNATYVDKLVHSEFAARVAGAKSGLRPGQVRNNVSTQSVSGARGALRAGQTPLYEISLTGAEPRKVREATLSLSNQVINQVSGYVRTKISGLQALLASFNAQLESNRLKINTLRRALANAQGLSQLDQLVLISQLDNAVQLNGTLIENKGTTEGDLALAKDVELPRIIAPPVPTKTTARSARNSMLVGGAIGLILGISAALLWAPVARRVRTA